MTSLFNIVWFVFFGALNALILLVLAGIMAITIIGWPIAKVLYNLAKLAAFPYGKDVIREHELNGADSVSSVRSAFGMLANLLWLPFGIVLAVTYIVLAVVAFITIVGIPLGIVYARLAKFVIWPVGAKVVTTKQAMASAVANEIEKRQERRKNTPVISKGSGTSVVVNVNN
jgi:uncharacterized membrane protein YccF (DUF307 family)